MLIGCFQALFERKTKRFLAYTSINQMGFLLIGVSSNNFDGYTASLLYLLIYIIMNIPFLCIFLFAYHQKTLTKTLVNDKDEEVIILVRQIQAPLVYLTDFRSFAQKHRGYGYLLALVLFSMAGLPLTAGFFGKFYLLLSIFL